MRLSRVGRLERNECRRKLPCSVGNYRCPLITRSKPVEEDLCLCLFSFPRQLPIPTRENSCHGVSPVRTDIIIPKNRSSPRASGSLWSSPVNSRNCRRLPGDLILEAKKTGPRLLRKVLFAFMLAKLIVVAESLSAHSHHSPFPADVFHNLPKFWANRPV